MNMVVGGLTTSTVEAKVVSHAPFPLLIGFVSGDTGLNSPGLCHSSTMEYTCKNKKA